MQKLFRYLKVEFFYVREMFRYGYRDPKIWFQYIKNRFFAAYLIEKLRPWACSQEHNHRQYFELHVLTQKEALWMLTWGLRSFLYFSRLCPRIVIHDDGSFDDRAQKTMERIFPGANVIRRHEADRIIEARDDISVRLKELRRSGKIVCKFTDSFLLANHKRVMIFDNDLLFFSRPQELLDFLNDKTDDDAVATMQHGQREWISEDMMMDDWYAQRFHPGRTPARRLNSGLLFFKTDHFPVVERMNEYFDHTRMKADHYFIEMAGLAIFLARLKFSYLPLEKYHMKGKPHAGTVMKHFTSPRRHEFYAYGIDMIRRKMSEHE